MDRSTSITAGLIVAGVVIAVLLGYYFGTITTASKVSTTTVTSVSTQNNSSAPYDLTLIITTNNMFNSTIGDQPAYYVLGPSGLESAASISLPAHRLIKLVIECYDDGPANLTNSQYANVSGTQNDIVTVVNNDNINSSQGISTIQVSAGQNVSSVPSDNISHTFSIPQLGINIPVMPSSTVSAYLTLNQTGTFSWFCMTQCGFGLTGEEGAMATPGWMTGGVIVS
jgi:heme/copper-type cytochrome/quinol oxidase subunit 2